MSTTIEWTDETWNPVTGCERISPGCAHCYAKEQWDRRHKAYLAGKAMAPQYAEPFGTLSLRLATPDAKPAAVTDTLDQARAAIPAGALNLGKLANEDLSIREVWM